MSKLTLYHYDHCPYCIKARMIFGLKSLDVALVALLNDDEATPHRLIGAKMVPILEIGDMTMPESMDIVRYIDKEYGEEILRPADNALLDTWLAGVGEYLYALVMPRWAKVPLEEFSTQSAINYFTRKKEAYIGSFDEHMAKTADYIALAEEHLKELAPLIMADDAVCGELSEYDIHLFATLRSLSVVKGVNYPPEVERYRQAMSARANIALHDLIAI